MVVVRRIDSLRAGWRAGSYAFGGQRGANLVFEEWLRGRIGNALTRVIFQRGDRLNEGLPEAGSLKSAICDASVMVKSLRQSGRNSSSRVNAAAQLPLQASGVGDGIRCFEMRIDAVIGDGLRCAVPDSIGHKRSEWILEGRRRGIIRRRVDIGKTRIGGQGFLWSRPAKKEAAVLPNRKLFWS